jgi:hypothetical protein
MSGRPLAINSERPNKESPFRVWFGELCPQSLSRAKRKRSEIHFVCNGQRVQSCSAHSEQKVSWSQLFHYPGSDFISWQSRLGEIVMSSQFHWYKQRNDIRDRPYRGELNELCLMPSRSPLTLLCHDSIRATKSTMSRDLFAQFISGVMWSHFCSVTWRLGFFQWIPSIIATIRGRHRSMRQMNMQEMLDVLLAKMTVL